MPWSDFHFLRPWWLLLLPLMLALYFIPALRSFRKNPWAKVIAPHLLPHLMHHAEKQGRSFFSTMMWSFFIILLVVALAGPTLTKIPADISFNKAPLIVCLEVSPHMLAKDILPSRLKRATFKLEDLLKKYKGAEISLIAFAGDAHVVVPLSDDYNTVLSLAKILSPELMPKKGVNIKSALTRAEDIVKRNGQARVLLITSTNVDGDTASAVEDLRKSGVPIIVWAFATDRGAPMESVDGQFDKNRQGNVNVSRLRRGLIDDLVKADNVMPIIFTQDNRDVLQVVRNMESAGEILSKKELFYDSWYDLGPYCLALAMAMFFACYFFVRERAWFLSLVFLFLIPSHDAKAGLTDWFLRKDQQAERALKAGDAKLAAELFSDDMRKGLAYYRAQMYDEAISHLKKVENSDGYYNLGNAFAQKGQLDEAISSYEQALKLNNNNDDARANKELLEKLKEKQQQEKSSSSQNKEQKESQDKDADDKSEKPNEETQNKPNSENQSSTGNAQDQEKPSEGSKSEKERVKQPDEKNAQENTLKKREPTEPKGNQNQEKEPKKVTPGASDQGNFDQETRYRFDQIEPNNKLYLKNKFLKESAKQKEGQ